MQFKQQQEPNYSERTWRCPRGCNEPGLAYQSFIKSCPTCGYGSPPPGCEEGYELLLKLETDLTLRKLQIAEERAQLELDKAALEVQKHKVKIAEAEVREESTLVKYERDQLSLWHENWLREKDQHVSRDTSTHHHDGSPHRSDSRGGERSRSNSNNSTQHHSERSHSHSHNLAPPDISVTLLHSDATRSPDKHDEHPTRRTRHRSFTYTEPLLGIPDAGRSLRHSDNPAVPPTILETAVHSDTIQYSQDAPHSRVIPPHRS